jgi:uncharacterized protein YndB with AHSA1/START domain
MAPQPTGELRDRDLVLTRRFRAPIADVWASITESERTALWFARWSGDARPGNTIQYQMMFEEGAAEGDMTIDACAPPHRLAVSTHDESGSWRLEARLAERDGTTELQLVHHLDDGAPIGEIGPGWEYYLDMLVASRDGLAQPDFDDYYPAQKQYYEDLR